MYALTWMWRSKRDMCKYACLEYNTYLVVTIFAPITILMKFIRILASIFELLISSFHSLMFFIKHEGDDKRLRKNLYNFHENLVLWRKLKIVDKIKDTLTVLEIVIRGHCNRCPRRDTYILSFPQGAQATLKLFMHIHQCKQRSLSADNVQTMLRCKAYHLHWTLELIIDSPESKKSWAKSVAQGLYSTLVWRSKVQPSQNREKNWYLLSSWTHHKLTSVKLSSFHLPVKTWSLFWKVVPLF